MRWLAYPLLVTAMVVDALPAGDWPQVLGPSRNGVAENESIRRDWGNETPSLVWEREVGQGYAGAAAAAGNAFIFHRRDDHEVIEAVDLETGSTVWKHRWPIRYFGRLDSDTGPRCVPVIYDDAVLLHGVQGRLVCVDRNSGTERWARDTRRDFEFPEAYFGVGSSPLVIADRVVVNVGGPEPAGVVAFSLRTGETVWQSTGARASYASPVTMAVGDRRIVLVTSWLEFLGLDAATGNVLFSLPFGQRGPTVTAANPVIIDSRHIFLSASYGIGARLIRIEADGDGIEARVTFDGNDLMSSQYATSVPAAGPVLFGIHGREDAGTCAVRCLDPAIEEGLLEPGQFSFRDADSRRSDAPRDDVGRTIAPDRRHAGQVSPSGPISAL